MQGGEGIQWWGMTLRGWGPVMFPDSHKGDNILISVPWGGTWSLSCSRVATQHGHDRRAWCLHLSADEPLIHGTSQLLDCPGGRQIHGCTPSLPSVEQAGKDSKVFSTSIMTIMIIACWSPYKVGIPQCWALKRLVMAISTQEMTWEGWSMKDSTLSTGSGPHTQRGMERKSLDDTQRPRWEWCL